jgi:hypothetical protein
MMYEAHDSIKKVMGRLHKVTTTLKGGFRFVFGYSQYSI